VRRGAGTLECTTLTEIRDHNPLRGRCRENEREEREEERVRVANRRENANGWWVWQRGYGNPQRTYASNFGEAFSRRSASGEEGSARTMRRSARRGAWNMRGTRNMRRGTRNVRSEEREEEHKEREEERKEREEEHKERDQERYRAMRSTRSGGWQALRSTTAERTRWGASGNGH